ncbi:MAG: phosphatidylinositol kinase, partial [Actinobacteria bacterium]|nr:phosphatidylinositol kinase [Actinomycetota bacterium]
MVQHWIEVDESFEIIEFSQSDDERLRKMALFDAIINNTDRKIGHLLPTQEGEILGCDHGVTFHVEDKLRTVLWQWRGAPLNQIEIAQLESFISNFE